MPSALNNNPVMLFLLLRLEKNISAICWTNIQKIIYCYCRHITIAWKGIFARTIQVYHCVIHTLNVNLKTEMPVWINKFQIACSLWFHTPDVHHDISHQHDQVIMHLFISGISPHRRNPAEHWLTYKHPTYVGVSLILCASHRDSSVFCYAHRTISWLISDVV